MFTVLAILIKIDAVTAGVAEYTVQNHRDAKFFCLSTQVCKILFCAEQRINFSVVGSIVTVVGMCLKNWIEVQAGHAKALQVRQFLGDAGKVTAKVVGIGDFSLFVWQIDRKIAPVRTQGAVSRDIFLRYTGIAETIREDLIEDAVAQRSRSLHLGVVNGELPVAVGIDRKFSAHRFVCVDNVGGAVLRGDSKIVKIQFGVLGNKVDGVAVVPHGTFIQLHWEESVAFAIAAQNKMSAFHTKIFWKVDGKAHSLTGSNRTKRLFKGGQSAVINTKVHKRIPFQKV